jgi:hypothetical protein
MNSPTVYAASVVGGVTLARGRALDDVGLRDKGGP